MHHHFAKGVGLDQFRIVLQAAFARNASGTDLTDTAEPLAQRAIGEGLGEDAIALAGEGAEDRAAEGDGGIFLKGGLVAGAELAELAGDFCFGLAFAEFVSEGGFEEAFLDPKVEQEMVDGFELLTEAVVFEVAEDGGDEGPEIVLVGE